jgi:shikimate kinase
MTIFLIGMMGCGKSYLGALLASELQYSFIDADVFIEQQQQQTISEIFATQGEVFFRNIETAALEKMAAPNTIIATGGGAPCFNNNMQWMNQYGLTIFLNEPIELLAQRLQKEQAKRPIIANIATAALPNFLEKKMEERLPFYSQAHITVTPSAIGFNGLLNTIKKLL